LSGNVPGRETGKVRNIRKGNGWEKKEGNGRTAKTHGAQGRGIGAIDRWRIISYIK